MRVWVVLLALFAHAAVAAPYLPSGDAVVLERLPVRPGDPVAAELRRLRAAVTASPSDPSAAASLARRYFELAVAEGDARYVGYAEGALRPWFGSANPPPYSKSYSFCPDFSVGMINL